MYVKERERDESPPLSRMMLSERIHLTFGNAIPSECALKDFFYSTVLTESTWQKQGGRSYITLCFRHDITFECEKKKKKKKIAGGNVRVTPSERDVICGCPSRRPSISVGSSQASDLLVFHTWGYCFVCCFTEWTELPHWRVLMGWPVLCTLRMQSPHAGLATSLHKKAANLKSTPNKIKMHHIIWFFQFLFWA